MNLENVKTFLYIVRQQSISGAAQALFISQSAISARLSQLEKELGVQLIERKKGQRTIELTPRGQAFIPLAERWLELNKQTMQLCGEELREPLTLAAPGGLHEHIIPYVIHKVLEQPNPPQVRLRTASSKLVYDMISSHEADVGLALRFVQMEGTAAIPVFEQEFVLLCPGDTVLPERKIKPEELDAHNEVSVASWTGDIRRWHDHHWDPRQRPYIQVDNNHMSYNYLTGRENWALCPASIAVSVLKKNPDRVAIRRLETRPPRQICYMVALRSTLRTKPDVIARLQRCLLEYAEEAPWLTPVQGG